jgi:rfaE bifunctional protein kinase chain/domain
VKVAVVGDLALDLYVYARPERLSREAPVPVLRLEREEAVPGCAANVAANLAALGADVATVGAVGDDADGARLCEALARLGARTDGVLRVRGRRTPVKTRVLAGERNTRKQQVLRLDRAPEGPAPDRAALARAIARGAEGAGAVVLSDYGLGLLDEATLDAVRAAAGAVPLVVDSRFDAARLARGAVLKLNEGEAEALAGGAIADRAGAIAAGLGLLERLGARAIVLTRGNQGMLVFEPDRAPLEVPIAGDEEIVDVTGAGDTVTASLAFELARGADLGRAAHTATLAASVVVMKQGTATCSALELAAALARAGA